MNAPLPAATAGSRTPAFIDLREFARDTSPSIVAAAAAGDDAFMSQRRIPDGAPVPVTAGVMALTAGQGAATLLPVDGRDRRRIASHPQTP